MLWDYEGKPYESFRLEFVNRDMFPVQVFKKIVLLMRLGSENGDRCDRCTFVVSILGWAFGQLKWPEQSQTNCGQDGCQHHGSKVKFHGEVLATPPEFLLRSWDHWIINWARQIHLKHFKKVVHGHLFRGRLVVRIGTSNSRGSVLLKFIALAFQNNVEVAVHQTTPSRVAQKGIRCLQMNGLKTRHDLPKRAHNRRDPRVDPHVGSRREKVGKTRFYALRVGVEP